MPKKKKKKNLKKKNLKKKDMSIELQDNSTCTTAENENTMKSTVTVVEQLIKANILAIIFTGVIISICGLILMSIRSTVGPYLRFVLPLPPLAVSAYVFVNAVFRTYQAELPSFSRVLLEIIYASVACLATFFLFFVLFFFLIFSSFKI